MAWLGFEKGCLGDEEAKSLLEGLGLTVLRDFEIEVEVRKEWVAFRVFEVREPVESVSCPLARKVGCRVLEGGKHLILGEVSAKIWDEAVRVCSPDGETELIPVYTYDAFLDIRMPSRKVRGLEPEIVVGGKVYRLPLSFEDLEEIAQRGLLEKVEKAASVYGLFRVISHKALEELERRKRERKEEARYEVDYESGYVVVMESGKVTAVALPRFFVSLVEEGRYEEASKIYDEAPEETKKSLRESLVDAYYLWKTMGKDVSQLKEFLERLGVNVEEK